MTSVRNSVLCLNDLIATCRDEESGFRSAAERAAGEDLRELFRKYSLQLGQSAEELQREVERLGGEPQKSGSVAGSLRRGWVAFKTAVAGYDETVLDEAERAEDETVRRYQEALAEDLPPEVRAVVERQYRKALEAHAQIHSLRRPATTGL